MFFLPHMAFRMCVFHCRNDDSYNNHSSTNREGGYRDGGHRDGGDRYSQQSRGEGGERRGYGEGGGERRGYGGGERRGYGEGEGERRGYGDRGGRRDGPSDRGGPPGYGDRGRYGDRRPEGGRYERGPGHSEGRYGDSEERRPREDDRRRRTPERDAPAERPKLHLVPRSKPKEEGAEPVATSSIFGGAKPVDTATREKEIEERLLKEKEEVKSPKEKAATSSIFGGAKPVDTAHREREIEERLRKSQEAEEVPSRSGEERQSRLHSNEGNWVEWVCKGRRWMVCVLRRGKWCVGEGVSVLCLVGDVMTGKGHWSRLIKVVSL